MDKLHKNAKSNNFSQDTARVLSVTKIHCIVDEKTMFMLF